MSDNLHEDLNDAIAREFFETNDDIDLDLQISWQTDLGFRVFMNSDGSIMARAGHPTSLTLAIARVIERAAPKIAEYRKDKAEILAAYERAMKDEDDD
jgi:hypothetical protein